MKTIDFRVRLRTPQMLKPWNPDNPAPHFEQYITLYKMEKRLTEMSLSDFINNMNNQGITQGVIAPESLWAWRGYDGDGWICSRAAQVACEKGFLLRKPYPELGFDLTKYTNKTLRLGGSRAPGSEWLA